MFGGLIRDVEAMTSDLQLSQVVVTKSRRHRRSGCLSQLSDDHHVLQRQGGRPTYWVSFRLDILGLLDMLHLSAGDDRKDNRD